MEKKKEIRGLKKLTRAGSFHVRRDKKGNLVPDTGKPARKYRVKGE